MWNFRTTEQKKQKKKSQVLSWIKIQFKVYLHGKIVPSNSLQTLPVHLYQTQIRQSNHISNSLPVFDWPIKRVWPHVYTVKLMFGTSTQVKFEENLKVQIDHVTTPLMKDTFHELFMLIQPRFSFTLYGTFCLYKVKKRQCNTT